MDEFEMIDRGFDVFVGKTIESIDATAINVVHIIFTDGTKYEIWAEDRHHGIEVIKSIQSKAGI